MEEDEVNPPAQSTSLTSQTPELQMSIDWHPVNFVKAFADGYAFGVDGRVEGVATACMMDGTTVIFWQP